MGISTILNLISRAPSAATDEALLDRIAHRERQAIEQLYERYSGQVYGMALQVQPDRARAEAIVTETFWYVWKHASRLKNGKVSVETRLAAIVGWVGHVSEDRTRVVVLEGAELQ